jgi:hypothetical protein
MGDFGKCSSCLQTFPLKDDGSLIFHGNGRFKTCSGSGLSPHRHIYRDRRGAVTCSCGAHQPDTKGNPDGS